MRQLIKNIFFWQDDYINNSDKNKLFIYPENELENQESVFNPTSGAVDM